MKHARFYRAGEAEEITSVPQDTQRNWRRFGFTDDPLGPDGKVRYDIRGLARLALIKTFNEHGFPMEAAARFADANNGNLKTTLSEMLHVASNGLSRPYKAHLAVLTFNKGSTVPKIAASFSPDGLAKALKAGELFNEANGLFVLDLAPIAGDIGNRLKAVDARKAIVERAHRARAAAAEVLGRTSAKREKTEA